MLNNTLPFDSSSVHIEYFLWKWQKSTVLFCKFSFEKLNSFDHVLNDTDLFV